MARFRGSGRFSHKFERSALRICGGEMLLRSSGLWNFKIKWRTVQATNVQKCHGYVAGIHHVARGRITQPNIVPLWPVSLELFQTLQPPTSSSGPLPSLDWLHFKVMTSTRPSPKLCKATCGICKWTGNANYALITLLFMKLRSTYLSINHGHYCLTWHSETIDMTNWFHWRTTVLLVFRPSSWKNGAI